MEHCISCRYFHKHISAGDVVDLHGSPAPYDAGICRKNPPFPFRSEPHDTRGTWPQVEGADWCGEHMPKLEY